MSFSPPPWQLKAVVLEDRPPIALVSEITRHCAVGDGCQRRGEEQKLERAGEHAGTERELAAQQHRAKPKSLARLKSDGSLAVAMIRDSGSLRSKLFRRFDVQADRVAGELEDAAIMEKLEEFDPPSRPEVSLAEVITEDLPV